MYRILIIEDDPAIRRELCDLLKGAGYEPLAPSLDFMLEPDSQSSHPGTSLDRHVSDILSQSPDLILLDIGLPGANGKSLLRALRQKTDLPVVMVTGNSAESDEVLSMSYGADDFITKPYNPDVLILRIAAILRRLAGTSSEQFTYHNLTIDLARGVVEERVSVGGSATKTRRALLTKNEMIILRHLLNANGDIVTREALMTDLWNNQEYINDNALTVNISRLRSKLKTLDDTVNIETRKGLGYIFS